MECSEEWEFPVSGASGRLGRGGGSLTLRTNGKSERQMGIRMRQARGAWGHSAEDFFPVLRRKLSYPGSGGNKVTS